MSSHGLVELADALPNSRATAPEQSGYCTGTGGLVHRNSRATAPERSGYCIGMPTEDSVNTRRLVLVLICVRNPLTRKLRMRQRYV
jgi:hypothetical protein